MVAKHAVEDVLIAELPMSKVALRVLLGRSFVTDLHVIDSGRDACFIYGSHQLIAELMVIDQSAVANRAIQHLELGAIRDPGSGVRHFNYLTNSMRTVQFFKADSSATERIA